MQAMDAEPEMKKKKAKPGSFQGLGLSQPTYKAVLKLGYSLPTPIQRKTIPTILEGQDVVAMARTGSGKTAAFIIPICERLKVHALAVGVRAVVLSPTRELAMQTAKFFRQLSRFGDLRCCLLVGGQAMEKQFEHLANNPDVIIATPGRLVHHMLEAELSLCKVEVLVFDEADRLFELGFGDQLQKVLDQTPVSRQCLLFSATLPSQLVSFSRAGIKNPVFVRLDVETTLSDALDLWFLYVRKDEKLAAAVATLRKLAQGGKNTIMFVATRHHVEFFGEMLSQLGMKPAIVYGAMDQVMRQDNIARFRHGKANVLVTTDVAARGIDIPLLDHVLNYDFPPSSKLFVHRSGRTARAGKSGLAVSLVALEDLPYTLELSLFLGHKLKVAKGEDGEEVGKGLLGSVPAMDMEMESLNILLNEDGSHLKSLYKSMLASYHLYNKTRPSASKFSVMRAREMLEDCGGPIRLQSLQHPAFHDESLLKQGADRKNIGATTAGQDFIQELRSFRPKLAKVGNVISEDASRKMSQSKSDVAALAVSRPRARDSEEMPSSKANIPDRIRKRLCMESAPEEENDDVDATISEGRGPRTSKRARRKQPKAAAPGEVDYDGFDVKVDGVQFGAVAGSNGLKSGPSTEPRKQFYLSVERSQNEEAKEQGLAMENYQMDLMPDDGSSIQKAKSVMRWDAKKKKFLPVMVSVDGRVVRDLKRKNESGQTVRGEAEKTQLYKKWAQSTKLRVQKVGEMEQTGAGTFGKGLRHARAEAAKAKNMDCGDDAAAAAGGGEDERKRKPVVPFHGTVEDKYLTNKQKRQVAKRSHSDRVVDGPAKNELKTASQMRKSKQLRETNKLKQQPHLRKAKSQELKQKRIKKQSDKQMAYGARTKARMLIIPEGAPFKKGKKRSGRGYGPRGQAS